MKLPRVRFTVRRMMVAVAVLAVVMGCLLDAVRLANRRSDYQRRAATVRPVQEWFRHPSHRDNAEYAAAAERLGRTAEKYERAARFPWLRVASYPPKPE